MAIEIHEDQPIVERAVYLPEGTYNAYNTVWVRDYGLAVDLDGVAVNDIGTVYAMDSGAGNSFIRTLAGVETNLVAYIFGRMFNPRWQASSVTGRYQVAENIAAQLIEVWRDDVVIWTRDPTLDSVDIDWARVIAISPNGEFIAFAGESIATGIFQWLVLYQGA